MWVGSTNHWNRRTLDKWCSYTSAASRQVEKQNRNDLDINDNKYKLYLFFINYIFLPPYNIYTALDDLFFYIINQGSIIIIILDFAKNLPVLQTYRGCLSRYISVRSKYNNCTKYVQHVCGVSAIYLTFLTKKWLISHPLKRFV